jgi:hypothetical protein
MSSPITGKVKNRLDRIMIALHQSASHHHRLELLADHIAGTVKSLSVRAPNCLDIGCGDMSLAEQLTARITDSRWSCIDIHPLPQGLAADERWKAYRQFDGAHIPFDDKSFSCALLCDVLHHAAVPDRFALLSEARRTADHVIVKDHFEYGVWSRQALRLMDFLGNYAYGVSVPDRYFSQTGFAAFVRDAGLRIQSMEIGIDLYRHLPLASAILRRQWQFIAVLQ